jgi:hypothetical protein
LADPSPNFNCKSVQARLATAWGYVKAQPEQEPVAWYRDEDGIRIYYETKCWDDAIPLYTAPQPWEKFCDSNCVWTDHHPDCKLAQPESVACVTYKEVADTMNGLWGGTLVQRQIAEELENTMLYTTPPQRKPLSDEEIDELRSGYQSGRIGSFVSLARAIEAKLKAKNSL